MRAHRQLARRLCTDTPRRSILSASFNEAAALLGGGSGRGSCASDVWSLLRRGESPLDTAAAAHLPMRMRELAARVFSLPTHTVSAEAASACGTHKALLRLHDGLEVETVVIPMGRVDEPDSSGGDGGGGGGGGGGGEGRSTARSTLCVSSQVGCAQACRFCATGRMGRRRNLATEEIVAQVFEGVRLARAHGLPPVRNIVFMGMGEPLDNIDAVERALETMTDQRAFGLSPRHVTLSTVAPSPEAVRRTRHWPARLAWSLHAADDRLRKMLVPSARHGTTALRDAFGDVLEMRSARQASLLVEATLIAGVNDSPLHAAQFASLLLPLTRRKRGTCKVKVNLIPYNRNDDLGALGRTFEPATQETVLAFRDVLVEAGLFCSVRAQRGAEHAAACGMLATASRRSERRREALERREARLGLASRHGAVEGGAADEDEDEQVCTVGA